MNTLEPKWRVTWGIFGDLNDADSTTFRDRHFTAPTPLLAIGKFLLSINGMLVNMKETYDDLEEYGVYKKVHVVCGTDAFITVTPSSSECTHRTLLEAVKHVYHAEVPTSTKPSFNELFDVTDPDTFSELL